MMKPTKTPSASLQSARYLAAPLLTVVCVLVSLFFCPPAAKGSDPIRPVARNGPRHFPVSTPEEQGMDSLLLAQAVDHFNRPENSDLYAIHSLTVIRHGHIVADVRFYPNQPDYVHGLASAAKVFLSTLIGIAIEKGYIENIHQRVLDFFPERSVANRNTWKETMTVQHLLTFTSGLGFDDTVDTDGMWDSDDWIQFALDLEMSHEPGTWWNYHQPTAFLLSAIISQTTGSNLLAFARQHLFGPLGVVESYWTASPNGHNSGFNELYLTPHDFAKLGQLFLQGGAWNGERIISESWIEEAISPQLLSNGGYMWAYYPERPEIFWGGGAAGQRLVVSPTRDLVIALTGGGHAHEDVEAIYLDAVDNLVFPAVQSEGPLPDNPGGVADLNEAIARAESPPRDPLPVDPLPQIAEDASGRTFFMHENPGGILTISLAFEADELRARMTATDEGVVDTDWIWVFGLDGIARCARGQREQLACGTGEWLDGSTVELIVDTLGLYEVFRLTVALSDGGDSLTVTVEDLHRFDPDPTWTMTGTARNP